MLFDHQGSVCYLCFVVLSRVSYLLEDWVAQKVLVISGQPRYKQSAQTGSVYQQLDHDLVSLARFATHC